MEGEVADILDNIEERDSESGHPTEEDQAQWQETLFQEVDKTDIANVPKEAKELLNEIKAIFKIYHNNHEEPTNKIEELLDNKIVSFLKNSAATGNIRGKKASIHKNPKANKKYKNNRQKYNHADENRNKNNNKNNNYNNNHANGTNKPNNKRKPKKNHERRYMYARCQELYKECPKKLADIIMSNNEFTLKPQIPPPQAQEIKNHYAEIWDTSGPENIPLKFSNLSSFKLVNFFHPVAAQEIAMKIKRIRTNTATGLDGIKKHHLLAAGVPLILASLFNMVLYTNHYPGSWTMNRK